MQRINFTALKCVRKQDVVGKDEPELWIDGDKKWGPGALKKGETAVLVPLYEDFGGSVEIVVKEHNPKKSTVLGTHTVVEGRPDPQPVDFKTSGAHYELTYFLTSSPTSTTST